MKLNVNSKENANEDTVKLKSPLTPCKAREKMSPDFAKPFAHKNSSRTPVKQKKIFASKENQRACVYSPFAKSRLDPLSVPNCSIDKISFKALSNYCRLALGRGQ